MVDDLSEGWEGVAERFMKARSKIGVSLVLSWAQQKLPQRGSIIDVGCGNGAPIAEALIAEHFDVFGIDASPTLIAAFRQRFPAAQLACEAAQSSAFFGRSFDAAISVGLLFLLSEENQHKVVKGVSRALAPGGAFLFSAPREICEWPDMLTGRCSQSLGEDAYARLLEASGLRLVDCHSDEGGNNYYDAVKVDR